MHYAGIRENMSAGKMNPLTLVSLSLICSKFYQLFLPELPKKLPSVLILFSHISIPIIPILFFMLFCFRYWLSEKRARSWCIIYFVVRSYCVNVSVHTHTSEVCMNESHPCLYLLIILTLCLLVSYNSITLLGSAL